MPRKGLAGCPRDGLFMHYQPLQGSPIEDVGFRSCTLTSHGDLWKSGGGGKHQPTRKINATAEAITATRGRVQRAISRTETPLLPLLKNLILVCRYIRGSYHQSPDFPQHMSRQSQDGTAQRNGQS